MPRPQPAGGGTRRKPQPCSRSPWTDPQKTKIKCHDAQLFSRGVLRRQNLLLHLVARFKIQGEGTLSMAPNINFGTGRLSPFLSINPIWTTGNSTFTSELFKPPSSCAPANVAKPVIQNIPQLFFIIISRSRLFHSFPRPPRRENHSAMPILNETGNFRFLQSRRIPDPEIQPIVFRSLQNKECRPCGFPVPEISRQQRLIVLFLRIVLIH